MELLSIREVPGIFVDAAIRDKNAENALVFLSAWGHDTAIQSFLARLSLPPKEGGLSGFVLVENDDHGPARGYSFRIADVDRLGKLTGRTPDDSVFQGLVHLWVYEEGATQSDKYRRQCWLLRHPQESITDLYGRLWKIVRDLCPVPLMAHWQGVMEQFQSRGFIRLIKGWGVDAFHIDLSHPDVETIVSSLVKEDVLSSLTLVS